MASYIDYGDVADEQPIDWGATCPVCGAASMTELCNNADCDGRPPVAEYDPQPEGDFSGASELEEWGGR